MRGEHTDRWNFSSSQKVFTLPISSQGCGRCRVTFIRRLLRVLSFYPWQERIQSRAAHGDWKLYTTAVSISPFNRLRREIDVEIIWDKCGTDCYCTETTLAIAILVKERTKERKSNGHAKFSIFGPHLNCSPPINWPLLLHLWSNTFHRSPPNPWFTSTRIRRNIQQHVFPSLWCCCSGARTSVNESRSTRTALLHAILPDLLEKPPKARSVTAHSFAGRRSETMFNAPKLTLECVITASRGFRSGISAKAAGFNSWRGENCAQEERFVLIIKEGRGKNLTASLFSFFLGLYFLGNPDADTADERWSNGGWQSTGSNWTGLWDYRTDCRTIIGQKSQPRYRCSWMTAAQKVGPD